MTDQLEDRLERTLTAQAQTLPSLPDRGPSAHPLVRQDTARVSWSRPAAGVFAAVVVLVLIGGPAWLLTRVPGTIEPAVPSGSATTGLPMDWSLSNPAPDGWNLGPVASSDPGTVLIGHSQEGSQARAWFTSDGANWDEIAAFDGGVVIRDLVGGSFGFLASGLRLPSAEETTTTLSEAESQSLATSTIWYSPDGMTWTETAVPAPPVEERLSDTVDYDARRAAGNSRVMVAVGDETDESGGGDMADGVQVIPSRPLVWWSEDGSTWQLVDEPAWRAATSTMGVAASNDRVAVVIAFGGESPYSSVWTSLDGRNWELAQRFEQGTFCGLAGSPRGFIATCNDGTTRFSVDGSVWEPSYLSPVGYQVGLITGGETGFAAILVPADIDPRTSDMSQVTTAVYQSSDGRRWESVSEPATFASGFLASGLGFSDRGFIVVGDRYGPGAMIDQIGSIVAETWIGVPQS
ncbi:MAG: hypothetical protein ACC654_02945 [Acidimicrobiia bacterium]